MRVFTGLVGVATVAAVATTSVPVLVHAADPPPGARPSAGGTVYFVENDRVASIQPDGQTPAQFPRPLSGLGLFQPLTARIAPDGRRLAFGLAESDGGSTRPPSRLYVMDLTKATGMDRVPGLPEVELLRWAWSPDGAKLAVCSWEAGRGGRNWVSDLRAGTATEVELPRVKGDAGEVGLGVEDWSPDGRSFAATGGGGVYLVGVDGANPRRLTPAGLAARGGTCRVSPDGRRVLFVGKEGTAAEALYVVETGSRKLTPVVRFQNFGNIQACWSPDGGRVAYTHTFRDEKGKRGTESNLNVVGVDGTNSGTLASAAHEANEISLTLVGWR